MTYSRHIKTTSSRSSQEHCYRGAFGFLFGGVDGLQIQPKPLTAGLEGPSAILSHWKESMIGNEGNWVSRIT